MPVFKSDGIVPDWCELRSFAVVELERGARHRFASDLPKEGLFVCRGRCVVTVGGQPESVEAGYKAERLAGTDAFEVIEVLEDATIVWVGGDWGDEVGGRGFFTVVESDEPADKGDPVPYPKRTSFDSHYHDCDEYWIVWAGRGEAVSEGAHYAFGPGDCIATGMGHHHDVPLVGERVQAVYFETTLEGAKRRGHLWEHTHGPARPRADRV